MNCQEVVNRLSEYWSDEVTETERQAIGQHLQQCGTCQQEWEAFQRAMGALRMAAEQPIAPPSDLLPRISIAVRTHSSPRFSPLYRWQWGIAAAVAAAVVMVFGVYSFTKTKRQSVMVAELTAPAQPRLTLPESSQPLQPPAASAPSLKEVLPPSPQQRLRMMGRPPETPLAPAKEMPKDKPIPPLQRPQLTLPEQLHEEEREVEIALAEPLATPQIAPLPERQPPIAFRAEVEIQERVKGETPSLEAKATPPSSPPSRPAGATPAPRLAAPAAGLEELQGAELRRFGGWQGILPISPPVQLRWARFEPVVVGKTHLWELSLTSPIPCAVTITLPQVSQLSVLNAQPLSADIAPTEWLLWEGSVPAGRTVTIPLLVRADEVGAKRLLLTIKLQNGQPQVQEWWLIFAVTEGQRSRTKRLSFSLHKDQWVLSDLLLHLAWEAQTAFLLPASFAQQPISVPIGTVSLSALLSMLERQMGGTWERRQNVWHFLPPIQTAPSAKQ